MDYTQIENYDCPQCSWSLHVEKRVWKEIDNHQSILEYIQLQVQKHNDICRINNAVEKSNSPYIWYSDSDRFTIIGE